MKGNKGEWSELYAFAMLLAQGRIYAADGNLNRIKDIYFPILKIFREEQAGKKITYDIKDKPHEIEMYMNDNFIGKITRNSVKSSADLIYYGIIDGKNRSFEIEAGIELMEKLKCKKIKAPSSDKTDISMQIHDIHTGYNPICGFSIKSELGNPPTLLNASKATNFVYQIHGLDDAEMHKINAINTRSKILDRMEMIKHNPIKSLGCANETFSNNLIMIDSMMEEILSYIIYRSYSSGIVDLKELTNWIEEENPLKIKRRDYYTYKIKKVLCAVALGMMPTKEWDGRDEANGGYVVVTKGGEVLAFHLYNRDYFEDYLLKNTKLDRGSTSKHDFASIYKKDDKYYINLNFQIRFK